MQIINFKILDQNINDELTEYQSLLLRYILSSLYHQANDIPDAGFRTLKKQIQNYAEFCSLDFKLRLKIMDKEYNFDLCSYGNNNHNWILKTAKKLFNQILNDNLDAISENGHVFQNRIFKKILAYYDYYSFSEFNNKQVFIGKFAFRYNLLLENLTDKDKSIYLKYLTSCFYYKWYNEQVTNNKTIINDFYIKLNDVISNYGYKYISFNTLNGILTFITKNDVKIRIDTLKEIDRTILVIFDIVLKSLRLDDVFELKDIKSELFLKAEFFNLYLLKKILPNVKVWHIKTKEL